MPTFGMEGKRRYKELRWTEMNTLANQHSDANDYAERDEKCKLPSS